MNAPPVKFLFCSLCFHCVLLWLLWQEGAVAYGVAPGAAPTSLVVTARIVGNETAVQPAFRDTLNGEPLRSPESPLDTLETVTFAAEPGPKSATDQDYAAAGRLTRLPVPTTDVDLNVAGINDIDVIGKIELTVLISRAGIVVDVIPVAEIESARVFAERVAQLFRNARFIPGEIDGKAVKSQLRLTVISERLGEPPAQ